MGSLKKVKDGKAAGMNAIVVNSFLSYDNYLASF